MAVATCHLSALRLSHDRGIVTAGWTRQRGPGLAVGAPPDTAAACPTSTCPRRHDGVLPPPTPLDLPYGQPGPPYAPPPPLPHPGQRTPKTVWLLSGGATVLALAAVVMGTLGWTRPDPAPVTTTVTASAPTYSAEEVSAARDNACAAAKSVVPPVYEASVPVVAALPNRDSPEYKAALANEQAVVLVEMEYLRQHTPPATQMRSPRPCATTSTRRWRCWLPTPMVRTATYQPSRPKRPWTRSTPHARSRRGHSMPAITKPFNLKPAEALAATATAPALAATVAAQTSTGATSMPAAASAAAHAMWAPVAATVVDDEALRQGLSATAMRRTTASTKARRNR